MSIESAQDLKALKRIGRIVRLTLEATRRALRPGVRTADLDRIAADLFKKHGARSAPKLVYGFPGTILISVNDAVVHGIPDDYAIQPGDLVKLDVTAELDGYMADAAITVAVPPVAPRHRDLCRCTEAALRRAVRQARAGAPIRAIGRAVEREARRHRLTIIPELTGHGIGRVIHEDPDIPNYYDPFDNRRLTEGLVITIEPLICSGSGEIYEDSDGWTVRTQDGSPAAHFEHTLVVTKGKPLLLTAA
ncbi:MAG: type I methionyl aminopeptidase [Gemmatimonadetes bacterium]|jgi:methionyl aminopeptidase|nr:type I methionyl aminopeptidase [Gemmatimonadota bacterium]